MDNRFPLLATGLLTELTTLVGGSNRVLRRSILPMYDRTDFAPGKTYVNLYCGAYGTSIIGRQVDQEDWDLLLAIQAADPDPDEAGGDNPFGRVTASESDPVAWGDSVFAYVETIKSLWRAETDEVDAGPLRDKLIAGCIFKSLEQNPTYVPWHLEELGILSIVLRLTYGVSDFTDQD